MLVQPYLMFDGRCEEAYEFYHEALGAEKTMLLRFNESPDPRVNAVPGCETKIMHMQFRVGESVIMASDGYCKGNPKFEGISLSLTLDSEAEADRAFAALLDGGTERMALAKTFFSPRFGMLTDRFGVAWMIFTRPH